MPGTLVDDTTDGSADPTETNVTTITLILTTVESTTQVPIFALGGALFYTVLGVAGGIIVLIFSFIIVCVLIGFSVRRKRKSHILTTASTLQPHNGIQTQGLGRIYRKQH